MSTLSPPATPESSVSFDEMIEGEEPYSSATSHPLDPPKIPEGWRDIRHLQSMARSFGTHDLAYREVSAPHIPLLMFEHATIVLAQCGYPDVDNDPKSCYVFLDLASDGAVKIVHPSKLRELYKVLVHYDTDDQDEYITIDDIPYIPREQIPREYRPYDPDSEHELLHKVSIDDHELMSSYDHNTSLAVPAGWVRIEYRLSSSYDFEIHHLEYRELTQRFTPLLKQDKTSTMLIRCGYPGMDISRRSCYIVFDNNGGGVNKITHPKTLEEIYGVLAYYGTQDQDKYIGTESVDFIPRYLIPEEHRQCESIEERDPVTYTGLSE